LHEPDAAESEFVQDATSAKNGKRNTIEFTFMIDVLKAAKLGNKF
jgi:hypothetical protein